MAETYILNFEANTSKAVKSVDKLDDSIKDTSKNTKELEGDMSGLDQASGGMITKFQGLKKGLKSVILGFKSMKVAIIATGIGALLIAVTALGAAFTSSEEGQNKFNAIMAVIGSVTGNLVDILASLGNAIIDVFTNPLESIKKFKDFIIQNITNRFNAIIDTLGFLGSAFKKVFSGDFSGAMDDAKKAGSSFVDSLTGVEDSLNKIGAASKKALDEFRADAKKAMDISAQRAKADLLERDLIVKRAEADRKRAELLEKAVDKQNFSTKQRIEFLEEAARLEEEITNKEIQAARIRLKAKQEENKLSGSKKEDLNEEATLKAELIRLETAKLTKQKEVTSQTIALRAEELATIKQNNLDIETAEKEHQDNLKKIKDFTVVDEFKRRQAAHQAIDDEYKALQLLAQENYEANLILAKDNDEKILAAQTEKDNALFDLEFAFYEKKEILQKGFDKVDLAAEKLKADKEIELDESVQSAKLGIAKNTMALIGEIAGKGSKIGKAMAIGQATISGYEGVQNAYTTAQKSPITIGFPAYPVIQASLAGAFAALNIAKIASTKPTGSSGTGGLSATGSAPQPQAPSFNIVGQGAGSQIASALGEQQQTPVQAFVVSQDVTTAQSLENGIIQGATLGG
jgi:hypothetical protein